jgi:hypothetical protein
MNFSVLQPASHPMRLIQHVGRFCHLSLRFPFLGDAEEVLAAKNTFIGIGAKAPP